MRKFKPLPSKGRLLFSGAIGLCAMLSPCAQAQICTLCPDNATDTAIGTAFTVLVVRNGVTNVLASGAAVEVGETVILRENVHYAAVGSTGGVGAGFSGGSGHTFVEVRGGTTVHEHIADVTPADMNTTLIGPASCPGNVLAKQMNESAYTVTPADLAEGFLRFRFEFTNGLSALRNPNTGECLEHVDAFPERIVTVVAPTCSIAPLSTNICQGTAVSFTASGIIAQSFDFIWSGPNGFTRVDSNVVTSTITIDDAQAINEGTYAATIVDNFGFTNTCTATLTVIPTPTCTISIPGPFCEGTTNVHTSTVFPTGGTVTHDWTITGDGTIQGSTTGASVTVVAGASGSYTLTDNITRDDCPGVCATTVNITFCPPPPCTPHKASATAQLVNGFVVGATLTDGGCGYTNAPVVLIQGGGGTGATARALITDGMVTSIQITDAGCCYTNAPKIVIGSPPFVPTVSIEVSRVNVIQNVVLGWKYVLENSTNGVNWTATGPEFVADSETIVSEFSVDTVGRFFRLRVVP